jgi:acyl carrier protein
MPIRNCFSFSMDATVIASHETHTTLPTVGDMASLVAALQGLPPSAVTPSLRLAEDLHIDSLEMHSLLLAIEDRYGVMLSAEDLVHVVSVGDLAAVIAWRCRDRAKPL